MERFQASQAKPHEEMRLRIRRLFDVSEKKGPRSGGTRTPGSKMQGSITEEHIEGVLDWIRTVARGGKRMQTFEDLRDGVALAQAAQIVLACSPPIAEAEPKLGLIQALAAHYEQELRAPTEAAAVGPDMEAAAAGDYGALIRLVQRLLFAALTGPRKATYLDSVMSLSRSSQRTVLRLYRAYEEVLRGVGEGPFHWTPVDPKEQARVKEQLSMAEKQSSYLQAEKSALLEATKSKEAQMAALWLKVEARAAEVTELQQRNKKLEDSAAKSEQEKAELESMLLRVQAKLQNVQEEKERLQGDLRAGEFSQVALKDSLEAENSRLKGIIELGKAEELRLGAEILALRERLLLGAEGRGEREVRLMEEIDRLRSESDRLRVDANERMLEINGMLREKERWNERAMTAEIAKAAAEASVRAGKERCEELKAELERSNLERSRISDELQKALSEAAQERARCAGVQQTLDEELVGFTRTMEAAAAEKAELQRETDQLVEAGERARTELARAGEEEKRLKTQLSVVQAEAERKENEDQQLKEDGARLQQAMAALSSDLNDKIREGDEMREELWGLKTEKQETENELQGMKEEVGRLNEMLLRSQVLFEEATEEIGQATRDVIEERARGARLEAQLEGVQREARERLGELGVVREELTRVIEAFEETKVLLSRKEALVEEQGLEMQAKRKELETRDAEIAELKGRASDQDQEVQRLGQQTEILTQALQEKDNTVQQAQLTLQEIEEKLAEERSRRANAERRNASLEDELQKERTAVTKLGEELQRALQRESTLRATVEEQGQQLEDLRSELRASEEQVTSGKASATALQGEVDRLKERNHQLSVEFDKERNLLEETRNENVKIAQEKASTEEQLASSESEVTRLVTELAHSESGCTAKESQLVALSSEKMRLEEELANVRASLEGARQESVAKEAALTAMRGELQASMQQTANLERTVLQMEGQLHGLQDVNEGLAKDLDEEKKAFKRLEAALASAEAERQMLDEQKRASDAEFKSSKANLEGRLKEAAQKMADLECKLETSERERTEGQSYISELRAALEHAVSEGQERSRQLVEMSEALQSVRTELAGVQSEKEELGQNLDASQEEVSQREACIVELREEVAQLKAQLDAKEIEIERQCGEIEKLEAELSERVQENQKLSQDLAAQVSLAQEMDVQIAGLSDALASTETELIQLEESLESTKSTLEATESRVDKLTSDLAARDAAILEKEGSIATMERELERFSRMVGVLNDINSKHELNVDRLQRQVVDVESQLAVKAAEFTQLEALLSAQDRASEAKQDELEEALKESQSQNEALSMRNAGLVNALEESQAALLEKDTALADKDCVIEEMETGLQQMTALSQDLSADLQVARGEVDVLSTAKSALEKDLSDKSAQIDSLLKDLKDTKTALEKRIEEAHELAQTQDEKVDSLQEALSAKEQQLLEADASIRSKTAELQGLSSELQNVQLEVGRLSTEVQDAESRIASLENALKATKASWHVTQAELEQSQEKVGVLERSVEKAKRELADRTAERDRAVEDRRAREEEVETAQKAAAEWAKRCAAARQEADEAKLEADQAKVEEAQVRRDLANARHQLSSEQQESRNLSQQLETAQADARQIRVDLLSVKNEFGIAQEEAQNKEGQLRSATKSLGELKGRLQEQTETNAELQSELEKKSQAFEQLQATLDAREADVRTLETKLSSMERQLTEEQSESQSEKESVRAELELVRTKLEQVTAAYEEASRQVEGAREEMLGVSRELEKSRERLRSLEEARKKAALETEAARLSALEEHRKAIAEVKAVFEEEVAKLQAEVETANERCEELTGERDALSCRLAESLEDLRRVQEEGTCVKSGLAGALRSAGEMRAEMRRLETESAEAIQSLQRENDQLREDFSEDLGRATAEMEQVLLELERTRGELLTRSEEADGLREEYRSMSERAQTLQGALDRGKEISEKHRVAQLVLRNELDAIHSQLAAAFASLPSGQKLGAWSPNTAAAGVEEPANIDEADGAALLAAKEMEQAVHGGRKDSTSLLAAISSHIARLQQQLEEKQQALASCEKRLKDVEGRQSRAAAIDITLLKNENAALQQQLDTAERMRKEAREMAAREQQMVTTAFYEVNMRYQKLQYDIRNGALATPSSFQNEPPSTPSHRFSLGGARAPLSANVRASTPAPPSSAKKPSEVLRASHEFLRTSGDFLKRSMAVVPLGDHQPGQQQARSPSLKTVTDNLRASVALPPSSSLLRQRPKSASNRASSEDSPLKSAAASPMEKPKTPAVHSLKFDR